MGAVRRRWLAKNSTEATVNVKKKTMVSVTQPACLNRLDLADHTSTSGVTIRMPSASPRHQIHQSDSKLDQETIRPRQRLVIPVVALTTVLSRAARPTKANVSESLSRLFSNFATQWSRKAPLKASRVFPRAMPQAVSQCSSAEKFSKKAPNAMAGQAR